MEKTMKFLQEAGTFYLATVEGDKPHVRPFGAVCEFEGKLYITTSNQKAVFAQMQKNPKVEITGMVGGTWIRLEAEAVRDDRREAREAMLNANESLRGMYSEDDGIMEVLYLKNATATFCSFTEAPVTCKF
jgi:uncharacterized pyridoxamine 5'-phosphate oxidase family protein